MTVKLILRPRPFKDIVTVPGGSPWTSDQKVQPVTLPVDRYIKYPGVSLSYAGGSRVTTLTWGDIRTGPQGPRLGIDAGVLHSDPDPRREIEWTGSKRERDVLRPASGPVDPVRPEAGRGRT